MTKQVTYIVSDIDKALAFEWVVSQIDFNQINLRFILLNPSGSQLEEFLKRSRVEVKRITVKGKKSYPRALVELWGELRRHRPDVVHCHLRDAELLGISAAWLLRIKKRIFTRHSSTYNHLYHPKGVKVDKLINRLSTDIVAITQNVKNVLIELENVPEDKISLIHHGFDLEAFEKPANPERLRKKYNIPSGKTIIGIIARYTWWKGYAYSIPGIAKFMENHPNSHVVIANANGNDAEAIRNLIKQHLSDKEVTQITFESDLPSLYQLFDYYVHVPFDPTIEAFGQTYIEALASGIPSVFTKSGIANDFIENEFNAMIVPFKEIEGITDALNKLESSELLRKSLIENGRQSVKAFSLKIYINALTELYLK